MRSISLIKIANGLVIIFVLAFAALSLPIGSHSRMTCTLCRMSRVETQYYFMYWASESSNDCTRWYDAHVEARHAHAWLFAENHGPWSFFVRSSECNFNWPLSKIEPDTQIEFYRHFDDPREAKPVFLLLADREFIDQRIDTFDPETKGEVLAHAIVDWVRTDCPDTWADWWAKAWKDHVDAHEDWLAKWHQSNATLK